MVDHSKHQRIKMRGESGKYSRNYFCVFNSLISTVQFLSFNLSPCLISSLLPLLSEGEQFPRAVREKEAGGLYKIEK